MPCWNIKKGNAALGLLPNLSNLQSELQKRIFVALIAIPLVLGIIFIGSPLSVLLGVVALIGLVVEWLRLSVVPFDDNPLYTLILLAIGFVYLGLSSFWLIDLLAAPDGWRLIFTLLFLVWSTDASAYFGGRKFGGKKLAPSISPNKTWSGFIVGISVGSLVGILSIYLFDVPSLNPIEIPFLAVISQVGDLFESKIKRVVGVKDSSTLLPGHGGLLDRLDSLLGVAFAMAFMKGF